VAAQGHWGSDLRRYMSDYVHWSCLGALCEFLAQPGNRVTLAEEKDRYGLPVANFSYSQCDNDKQLARAAQSVMEQILHAAGHPIRRIALVTPPQEPVDRLIRVTDKVMTDFCYYMGGVETGMPIVKRQLGLAGLDVRAPTADAIRNLIERLAVVERDFKGPEEVEANRERRLGWLDGNES